MLRSVAFVQAFESKSDKLELTQDQTSLVMVDELRGLVVRPLLSMSVVLPAERRGHLPAIPGERTGSLQ